LEETVGDGVVEPLLFRGEVVAGRCGVTRLEEGAAVPVDHLLLEAAEEEAVAGAGDGGVAGFDFAGGRRLFPDAVVDVLVLLKEVFVEEEEQAPEGVFAAPVRGGREEEQMVRAAGQLLEGFVAGALFELGPVFVGGELVGFVDNDEVPGDVSGGAEAGLVAGDEVDGGDEDAFVDAGELCRVGIEGGPVDDGGMEAELAEELFFGPLLGEAARGER
jgi:hypothetical protein